MRVGDLVNITEKRGTGEFYVETPLGIGLVLDIKKTDDLMFGSIGPVNLGNEVTVHLCPSGEVARYIDRSLEVINVEE
tara:strand:+ start:157 stop:390 length:234 start_codon:yes stop_codon:yes gene_type:complete